MIRRFSLWSLLVTLTLLALGVTCVVLSMRLRRSDAHLADVVAKSRKLEAQLGIVAAGDASQIQVLFVPQTESMHWKWRLRLPLNSRLRLCYRVGAIGEEELDARDGAITLKRTPEDDDITEIEMHLYRDKSETWKQIVKVKNSTASSQVSPAMQAWLTDDGRSMSEVAGLDNTKEFAGQQPIVLLRWRDAPPREPGNPIVDYPIEALAGPTQHGIRLWLEKDDTNP